MGRARGRERVDTFAPAAVFPALRAQESAFLEAAEGGVEVAMLAFGPPADVLVAQLELELVAMHGRPRERRQDQNVHFGRGVGVASHGPRSVAGWAIVND